jgi:hypothetical protein
MDSHKIRSADVLNWDYLCEISQYVDPSEAARNLQDALAVFAYAFTSTADPDVQDRLLRDLLVRATFAHSADSAEEIVRLLARRTRSDLRLLRQFARQCGIRLKRG